MNSTLKQIGTNYQLHVTGPSEASSGNLMLGIKSAVPFAPGTNYVSVILNKQVLTEIVADLQRRLSEM